VVANILPAVINTGWNNNETLVAPAKHELIDGSVSRRGPARIVTDDHERSCRSKKPVNRETVQTPGADAARKRCRHGDLDKPRVGHTPVIAINLRKMTVIVGDRARETITDALDRIEPQRAGGSRMRN